MKIEKLPSGSYRIRKMYKGQMYTVTFEHKPTQKEAMQAMAAELDKVQLKHESLTFKAAADKYLESKKNVLSPSTITGYNAIIRQISDTFIQKNVHDITALDVQAEINRMAEKCSPKTVRNYHGFISAVLGVFYPNLKLTTTLPQKVRKKPYIPSDEEIRKILDCAKGTEYEIPIILACYGMRRSEICALTLDDISGDTVTVNKAKVINENKEWVIKNTAKTTASTREIIIPVEIADKPDWIIEIVSPSTERIDYGIKLFKYRSAGVREYWIINPKTRIVNVFDFEHDQESAQYRFDDVIPVCIYADLTIRVSDLF